MLYDHTAYFQQLLERVNSAAIGLVRESCPGAYLV